MEKASQNRQKSYSRGEIRKSLCFWSNWEGLAPNSCLSIETPEEAGQKKYKKAAWEEGQSGFPSHPRFSLCGSESESTGIIL